MPLSTQAYNNYLGLTLEHFVISELNALKEADTLRLINDDDYVSAVVQLCDFVKYVQALHPNSPSIDSLDPNTIDEECDTTKLLSGIRALEHDLYKFGAAEGHYSHIVPRGTRPPSADKSPGDPRYRMKTDGHMYLVTITWDDELTEERVESPVRTLTETLSEARGALVRAFQKTAGSGGDLPANPFVNSALPSTLYAPSSFGEFINLDEDSPEELTEELPGVTISQSVQIEVVDVPLSPAVEEDGVMLNNFDDELPSKEARKSISLPSRPFGMTGYRASTAQKDRSPGAPAPKTAPTAPRPRL